MNKLSIAAGAVLLIVGGASSASAEGFIGGLVNKVVPGAGTTLDNWNHNLGRPAERAGGAVLNYFYPGAGTAAEAIWENNAGGPPQGMRSWAPQGGGFRAAQPQQAMRNLCATPYGVFGPGAYQPVGSPCVADYGRLSGWIVQQ